jgi:hypothetical protein
MDEKNITPKKKLINLQALMNAQFDAAKFDQNMAVLCSIIVLILDIVVTFTSFFQKEVALIVGILVIASAAFLWRSSRLRDTAEGELRKFEFYKGLGWEISSREVSDILASAPNSVKKAARRSSDSDAYFIDTSDVGPQKLLRNLEESSWWTKQLARRMTNITAAFSIVVATTAVITLVISLQNALSQTVADNIASATISVIVFLFAGGYVRLAFDYHLLSLSADKAEAQACELLQSNQVNQVLEESEAVKVMLDYQIARTTAPLIPTWLWKMNQDELNKLWDERVTDGLSLK